MRLRTAVLAVAVSLLLPAGALAAPDRSATVNGTTPATWAGGPVTGLIVVVVDDDDTLLTVEQAGSLTVTTTEPDDSSVDIDLFLYKSDDAGEPVGDPIAEAVTGSAEETVTADVEAGKYLVRVQGFLALEGAFKGTATLTASGATPPPPPSTPPPAADAAPKASVKSAGKSRFAGSARDDKGVKRVEVGVVKVAGKKCSQLTKSGSFKAQKSCGAPTTWLAAKGTSSWSFKLKKALKKGTYAVYVRAIDSAGQAGAPARKTLKVK